MPFDKIIVLDDEMIIRKSLEQQLRKRRYSVASASTLAEAQKLLGKDNFDLMFVDVRLPDGQGTELLELFQGNPDAPMVIMITGYGSIEDAVKCMSLGAFSYIQKPFSQDQIDIHLKKAEEHNQAIKVNRYYSSELQGDQSSIIGKSAAIENLKMVIRKVAATEATVLISGENGTGKEMVSHELYRLSSRVDKPYIKVNCAAVSETLIESEFFGHEKGAFTGATERREGRFELAHNGTILLDEISEIPTKLQSKLLRVLQEQQFERVGGNKTMDVDVRVLSTTNRDLRLSLKKGEFREDLFYRLNVFPIVVPPLREREGDVMLLAEHFLNLSSRKNGINVPGFSDKARRMLETHIWPGNIRELQNTIERAVILSENDQPIQDFSLGLHAHPLLLASASSSVTIQGAGDYGEDALNSQDESVTEDANELNPSASGVKSEPKSLETIEKEHILRILAQNSGNRTATAEILKVSIRTLRNKLNQYRDEGVNIP